MRYKKGFIQIPLLIAIIAGLLVLGGGGYLGVRQYKNYQIKKADERKAAEELTRQREEELRSLTGAQQQAIKEAQAEIDELKNRPPQVVVKEKIVDTTDNTNSNNNSNDLVTLIEQWKPRVAKLTCSFNEIGNISSTYGWDNVKKSGSGYLIRVEYRTGGRLDEVSYVIATNGHVVMIPPLKNITDYKAKLGNEYYEFHASSCDISFPDHSRIYQTTAWKNGKQVLTPAGLGYIHEFQDYIGDPNGVDFALVKIQNPDSYIYKNVSSLSSCSNVKLGEKVAIFGFPGIGSDEGITVTEGIISGEEENYFVTSAKIDSGNSGGVAVLIDRNCFVGTPTATVVGQAESLGRILKTEYLLRTKGIFQ